MNEYNERILKNVLEDYREENDAQLLKEIDESKNNPLFQNKEGEAEAFAGRNAKKSKKKKNRIFLRVASILLVITIGFAFIPFTVEGRRISLGEIVVNYVNHEYFVIDSSNNDDLFFAYKGEYVPTKIPEGYYVDSIYNGALVHSMTFVKDENMIIYKVSGKTAKSNFDTPDDNSLQYIEIGGYSAVTYITGNTNNMIIVTEDSHIYISCDDASVDLIEFAENIEKK